MRRGDSGQSCLIAIDKPAGMTSHDVVNAVRRVIGEKRVGHCGTLDPFASGVLLVMAGPATRLDQYLTGHEKSYVATIVFGASTTTDDCTGSIVKALDPPKRLTDENFAKDVLRSMIGHSMQIPPAFSAIKVKGRKACDEARKGNVLKIEPRPITVHEADLLSLGLIGNDDVGDYRSSAESSVRNDAIDESLFASYEGLPFWRVSFNVSKGTYIRSLARDIGNRVGCPSHLGSLKRISSGNVSIDECSSIEELRNDWRGTCIDPVKALGLSVLFADGRQAKSMENGRTIEYVLEQIFRFSKRDSFCECTPPFLRCDTPLSDGDLVSVVCDNRLKAIYGFSSVNGVLSPECVFNIGVSRGFVA